MFKEDHYVPILKWKRGEQKAIEFLKHHLKNKLTPLIEIVPIAYDFENDCPAKTVDEHLSNFTQTIINSWGTEYPLFVDPFWIEDIVSMGNGTHPLSHILSEVRNNEIKAIPVTGFNREPTYLAEVKAANKVDKLGICIRLEDEDFLGLDETKVNDMLSELEVKPEEVDIILDFKYISPNDIRKDSLTAISIINSMPFLLRWRTLTLCASSFPEDTREVAPNTTGKIERAEIKVWETLLNNRKKINRMPTFGDYCIANPLYIEIDPRIMQMSANIRYTSTEHWIIFKGRSTRRYGFEQYYELAKNTVNHAEYFGSHFSWGDKCIYDCAQETTTTGNAETWRRIGTNHHITFVIDQISSFFSP